MIGQSSLLVNEGNGLILTGEAHGGYYLPIIFLTGKLCGPVETYVDRRSVALFGLLSGLTIGLITSFIKLKKR